MIDDLLLDNAFRFIDNDVFHHRTVDNTKDITERQFVWCRSCFSCDACDDGVSEAAVITGEFHKVQYAKLSSLVKRLVGITSNIRAADISHTFKRILGVVLNSSSDIFRTHAIEVVEAFFNG